jgi:hypothetical protein
MRPCFSFPSQVVEDKLPWLKDKSEVKLKNILNIFHSQGYQVFMVVVHMVVIF